jgi:hypothetical protein
MACVGYFSSFSLIMSLIKQERAKRKRSWILKVPRPRQAQAQLDVWGFPLAWRCESNRSVTPAT